VLDGAQALEYVRARYVGDGSDLSRIERQKAFMASMLDRALSRGMIARPDRLVRFLNAATENLQVDDSLDLRELATSLRRIDPAAVTMTTVPLDPAPDRSTRRAAGWRAGWPGTRLLPVRCSPTCAPTGCHSPA
jgi:anionic cell wall polymer biosynthesis LytR-Cps2A-Psr (LCP) family protein